MVTRFRFRHTYKKSKKRLKKHKISCILNTFQLGGPSWTVQLGRRDSTTASFGLANSDLPGPGSDLNGLINAFNNKGFTPKEMVALSGNYSYYLL